MIQFIVKGKLEEVPEGFSKLPGHYIAEFEELNKNERERLKENYPKGFFRLSFWEKGGANFEDGDAQIVCGAEGEKLIPVKIRKKGWLANERHALFTGLELCVIKARQEKRAVTLLITKYTLRTKDGFVMEEDLWSGTKEEIPNLPEHVKSFEEALTIATKKSLEYRCLVPMYFEPKE